ncbi:MAG: ABC transporter substrate-binding protein [Burkholderiales bacterium]
MRTTPLLLRALCAATCFLAITSHAQTLKTVRVAHDIWVGYAGYYVALDKKFFKDAGLKVIDKTFNMPADGVVPLIQGDVDIHLSTLDTFLGAESHSPGNIRMVALVDSSNGADAVIAKSSIPDLAALKGKTVGVSLGQTSHFLLLKGLAEKKVPVSELKLVNMNADAAGNAFAAGKLDAAVTWEPFVTQGLSKGGKVLYSSSDAPDTIINAVAVKPKTLETKRPEVIAFLKAYFRGVDWALQNPAAAAVIVGKALQQKPDEMRAMMAKDKLYTKAESVTLIGTAAAPGKVVVTTGEVGDFMLANKVISRKANAAELFDASLLEELK